MLVQPHSFFIFCIIILRCHLRAAYAEFAQQDVGVSFGRVLLLLFFQVEQSVYAAEEEPAGVGAPVVGIVAEFAHQHARVVVMGVEGAVRGVVFHQSPVGR